MMRVPVRTRLPAALVAIPLALSSLIATPSIGTAPAAAAPGDELLSEWAYTVTVVETMIAPGWSGTVSATYQSQGIGPELAYTASENTAHSDPGGACGAFAETFVGGGDGVGILRLGTAGFTPGSFGLASGDWSALNASADSSRYQVTQQAVWELCPGVTTTFERPPRVTPIFLPGTVEELNSLPVGTEITLSYSDGGVWSAFTANMAVTYTATKLAQPTDSDADGVPDATDNCDFVENTDQADWNLNDVGDACDDSDGDSLTDALEFQLGTDPLLIDSDGDTIGDGEEVAAGTDPLDPNDPADPCTADVADCGPTPAPPGDAFKAWNFKNGRVKGTAFVEVTAERDRWGAIVSVVLQASSQTGEHCAYAEVTIDVKGGPDGTVKYVDFCGNDTVEVTNRITPPYAPVVGSEGQAIKGVKVRACAYHPTLPVEFKCKTVKIALGQHEPAGTPAKRAQAQSIYALSLQDFIASKELRPVGFDWSDDGCSAPVLPGIVDSLFIEACERHDWAYRNFGKGWLNPTDDQRLLADRQFRTDARALCNDSVRTAAVSEALRRAFPGHTAKQACRTLANLVFASVYGFGGPAFYGEG